MAKNISPERGRLRELFHDPERVTVFAWKNVVILVWRGDATVDVMRQLGLMFEAQVVEAGRMSVVSLIQSVAELPGEEKRQAYKEFMATHGAKFTYVALVLDHQGFLGSAVRALVIGLMLVTGNQQTVKVVSSIGEVAQWLPAKHAASTGVVLDAKELESALEEARSAANAS
jgi:hypothetical protein